MRRVSGISFLDHSRHVEKVADHKRAECRIALARRELAATLAAIFLRYDLYRGQQGPTLELYDTVRARDIDAARDYITPFPTNGSKGLRVRIRD